MITERTKGTRLHSPDKRKRSWLWNGKQIEVSLRRPRKITVPTYVPLLILEHAMEYGCRMLLWGAPARRLNATMTVKSYRGSAE